MYNNIYTSQVHVHIRYIDTRYSRACGVRVVVREHGGGALDCRFLCSLHIYILYI